MKNLILYITILLCNITVSAFPSNLAQKNSYKKTVENNKTPNRFNQINFISTDLFPPKANQILNSYEGFYDIYYISGNDTIKTSIGDKNTWVYTDNIEIIPTFLSGRLFETVFINRETNQKEQCGFVQNYVKVNNVVRGTFDNNTMLPTLSLNENDTVHFDYICCPAECTDGLIHRVASAIMIVKSNITAITHTAKENLIEFDPMLKIISSNSLIEKGTIINLQGKLMAQYNTTKYLSLGTLPSGNYIFTGIVSGTPLKKMIHVD